MSNIRDFLTGGNFSDQDIEELENRLKEVNARFIASTPEMKAEAVKISQNDNPNLEMRTVQMAMPPIYWDMLDKFVELYEITDIAVEKQGADTLDGEIIQRDVRNAFREKCGFELKEVLISQAIIDQVAKLSMNVVRVEMMYRLQAAISSGDAEEMKNVINTMREQMALLQETPANDDPKN